MHTSLPSAHASSLFQLPTVWGERAGLLMGQRKIWVVGLLAGLLVFGLANDIQEYIQTERRRNSFGTRQQEFSTRCAGAVGRGGSAPKADSTAVSGVVPFDVGARRVDIQAWKYLSDDMRADRASESRILVCIAWEKAIVGTYVGGGAAGPGYRESASLTVIDLKDGDVATASIMGPDPPERITAVATHVSSTGGRPYNLIKIYLTNLRI